ncbi:hypothetical protein CFB44_04510 [Burkholderia sp. AU31280]|nr:hypothetical protein CFB44_04510 [Burkholderia sp. AU31280]RQV69366.1 hypothetical protein DF024_00080 [Burkholderia cenocepacia]
MHVAWKQCSENPPRAYRPFVANCNCTRPQRPSGAAPDMGRVPCRSRDSVRGIGSRHADRSVLPDPAGAAGTRT